MTKAPVVANGTAVVSVGILNVSEVGSLASLNSFQSQGLLWEPPAGSRGWGLMVYPSVAEMASTDGVVERRGEGRDPKPIEPVSVATARACIVQAFGASLELSELPVGMGGTGAVFVGNSYDPKLPAGRMVYKVIHAPLRDSETVEGLLQHDPFESPCGAAQLALNEARKQRELAGAFIPGVPEVYDIREGATEISGERVRHVVIAMRYVPGLTMQGRAEAGVPTATLLEDFEVVVGEVARMHEKGFVHRDLKPDNVLGGKPEGPFVLDYGFLVRSGQELRSFSGTLEYAAPEQVPSLGCAVKASPQMDVHALGASLFHLVQGEPPNAASLNPSKDRAQARNQQITRLRNAAADPEAARGTLPKGRLKCDWALEAIIRKAMAPVGERYADAGALLADLKARREGRYVGAVGEIASPVGRLAYGGMHFLRRNFVPASVLTVGAMFVAAAGFAAQWSHERHTAEVKAANDQKERETAAVNAARSELREARQRFGDGDLNGSLARLAAETRLELRLCIERARDEGVREELTKVLEEHEALGKSISLVVNSRRKYIEFCRTFRNPVEIDGKIRMTREELKSAPVPWSSERLKSLSSAQGRGFEFSEQGVREVVEQIRNVPELRFRREVAERYCEAFTLMVLDRHPELLRGLPCEPSVEKLRAILADIGVHRGLVKELGADAQSMELMTLVLERQVLLLLSPQEQAAAEGIGVRSADVIAEEINRFVPREAGVAPRFVSTLLKWIPTMASGDPLTSTGYTLTEGLLIESNNYAALLLRLYDAEAIAEFVRKDEQGFVVWQRIGGQAAAVQIASQIMAIDPDHEPALARAFRHWELLEDFRRFSSTDDLAKGLADYHVAGNTAGIPKYFARPKALMFKRLSETGVVSSPELRRDILLFWGETVCCHFSEGVIETREDVTKVHQAMIDLQKSYPNNRRVMLCLMLSRELSQNGKLSATEVDQIEKLQSGPWTSNERYIWCQLLGAAIRARAAEGLDVRAFEVAYHKNFLAMVEQHRLLPLVISRKKEWRRFGGEDVVRRFSGSMALPGVPGGESQR